MSRVGAVSLIVTAVPAAGVTAVRRWTQYVSPTGERLTSWTVCAVPGVGVAARDQSSPMPQTQEFGIVVVNVADGVPLAALFATTAPVCDARARERDHNERTGVRARDPRRGHLRVRQERRRECLPHLGGSRLAIGAGPQRPGEPTSGHRGEPHRARGRAVGGEEREEQFVRLVGRERRRHDRPGRGCLVRGNGDVYRQRARRAGSVGERRRQSARHDQQCDRDVRERPRIKPETFTPDRIPTAPTRGCVYRRSGYLGFPGIAPGLDRFHIASDEPSGGRVGFLDTCRYLRLHVTDGDGGARGIPRRPADVCGGVGAWCSWRG